MTAPGTTQEDLAALAQWWAHEQRLPGLSRRRAEVAGQEALDVDEAVFDVVDRIPPGRVSTYGAIGRLVGVGPRRVARALSSGGGAVPWHRVVRADGTAAEPVRARQLELLAGEGVPVRAGRVDLAAVRWP